jgi:hypothetical protein
VKRATANPEESAESLVLVDESNITSSAKGANRKLDWLKLQEFLVRERELIEMVVYAGLPPAMTEWQASGTRRTSFCIGCVPTGFSW